jgi:prepilin-type N-terminal cleavage/methylation domain-containing protein
MLSPASLWKATHGYTLMEIMVVVGLISIGSAVAIPVTMRMVHDARGDSAMTMTATFLQTQRNRAVSERRNIIITFPTDTTMQAERVEVPSGDLTVIDEMTLEGEEQFLKLDGLTDTVDVTGANAVNFTGDDPVMFTSDGSFIDSAGDVTNATIFVARPEYPDTQRAITVMGVTGLVRTWKWRGSWQQ